MELQRQKGKEKEVEEESTVAPVAERDPSQLGVDVFASVVPAAGVVASDPTIVAGVLDLNAPIAEALGASHQGQAMAKDIIAVIDVSGSMGSSMMDVIATLKSLIDHVGPQDRLALITFNDKSTIKMALTSMSSDEAKRDALRITSQLAAGGTTNISGAMDDAVKVIESAPKVANSTVRMTLTLLLSDGQPNVGIRNASELTAHVQRAMLKLGNLPVAPLVLIHSLGFTTGHDSNLLRSLTSAGNAGVGLYYFLRTVADIPAAVGDALGSVSAVLYHHVRVQAIPVDRNGDAMPGWICTVYDGSLLTGSGYAPVHQIGYLASSDQKNIVLVCLRNKDTGEEVPAGISVSLWYTESNTGTEHVVNVIAKVNSATSISEVAADGPVLSDDMGAPASRGEDEYQLLGSDLHSLHVLVHIIRNRASALLSSMASARVNASEVESLHAKLVQVLGRIQSLELSDKMQQAILARDESILLALERDLGNALEQIHNGGRLSAQDQMRLAQFSHEHAQQRSASSATELRPTYSTPEQEAMRNKFGGSQSSSDPDVEAKIEAEATQAKSILQTNEDGLSPESVAKREAADTEIQCFVTLETWRSANIGIGLFVHPRTMRERYKGLVPQIDLANDYISTDAYNQGARADFSKPKIHAAGGASMSSSTRGKINAWLPLVINEVNWKYVSLYAPAAFSIIVRGGNDMFRPMHALQVCSRLMCTAVVQFCDNKLHLSERAVQLYCDVHRLLLQMIVEHPNIQNEATKKLTDFVQKEWSRGRDVTPDIGVLIQYLSVAHGMQWPDFREAYIQESFRRSGRWMESRLGRRLSIEESDEDLVRLWFEGSKVSMSLMLFNVSFLELVARPENSTLDDVRKRYDQNWGRVTDDLMNKIKQAYKEIESIVDLPSAMARVGAKASTVAEIAALIRWAIQNEKEIPVPREIKSLSDVGTANAAYQRLVVRRTQNSTAPDKLKEAIGYSAKLSQAFEALLAAGVTLVPLTDDMLSVKLSAFQDGPIAFLRGQKPESISGISLRFSDCDHTVAGRSAALGVAPENVLKEMLFLVDGQPVLVLKNGFSHVDTSALGGTTAKLCPTEYFGLHTSFTARALPAFGHRTTQPLKVVISTSVTQDMDLKTVIVTSAGCNKFFFMMTVETLLSLLVGADQRRV